MGDRNASTSKSTDHSTGNNTMLSANHDDYDGRDVCSAIKGQDQSSENCAMETDANNSRQGAKSECAP